MLLLLLQLQGTAPAATASLDGVVVRAGTVEPIANVTVSLGGRTGNKVVVTGTDGRFSFQQLEPGPYFLNAAAPGLHRDELTPFTLKGNDNLKNLRIAMEETGVISGRVLDAAGDPAVRAVVQAQRFSYRTGALSLFTVQAVLSDDRGEYRLFWLPPGDYVISATPSDPRAPVLPVFVSPNGTAHMTTVGVMHPANKVDSGIPVASRVTEGGERIEEASLPIYFPGTPSSSSATRINVRPGSSLDGVDIRVAPVRSFRVRGRVLSATGVPVASAMVNLYPRHPDGRFESLPLTIPANTGTFELSGITPGSYVLVAQARLPGNGVDVGESSLLGFSNVDVGTSNIDNVAIIVRNAYSISGRVLIEGQPSAQTSTGGRAAQVTLRPEGLGQGTAFDTHWPVAQDGSFTMTTSLTGQFQILFRSNSEIGYVRSIRLGPGDALNSTVRLDGPPSVPVEVVISTNAAKLEGTVTNQQREPVFNATVVLVPEARLRARKDLYLTGQTDPAGKFRLGGIAPGVYFIYAWEDVEQGAWLDPVFMRSFENLGRPVSFVEGSSESLELNAIPYR